MAKKQTRRSISVSRTTYERLKAFCETNNISMSQLVETRVNDFLGADSLPASPSAPTVTMSSPAPMAPRAIAPMAPRAMMQSAPVSRPIEHRPLPTAPAVAPSASYQSGAAASSTSSTTVGSTVGSTVAQASAPVPMTSAAARFAVDPPPPIIKPRQDTAAPKPAEKRPEQIFTF
jgi:hypothetical protein